MKQSERPTTKILIADDSEINRAILSDMLGTEYVIIEAGNGKEALERIHEQGAELSLILLDIVMPELDGFGVLEEMNRTRWIEDIPVIMISAETGAEQIERAYNLGATDFISRPFDPLIVHKRVVNTILLYAKQKQLVGMVAQQFHEKKANSDLMIEVLGHIVEFRNGESGLHIRHVHLLTELILRHLNRKGVTHFTEEEIAMISSTSALHDVGKISIPEQILNKPGRLTKEEFEVMKTHTTVGAQMLEELPVYQDHPMVRTAYAICRWHHERYDGRGYPDGLKGDDIPMSAQVVALADVYDALTSPRVYKAAIPHEEAVRMILNNECGVFNPLLMDCLRELGEDIRTTMEQSADPQGAQLDSHDEEAEALFRSQDVQVSKRTLQLLEHERIRHDMFAALSNEIQFEFTMFPPMLKLTTFGAQMLHLPEELPDPFHDPRVIEPIGQDTLYRLSDLVRGTSPGEPMVELDCQVAINGQPRWHRLAIRANWSGDEPPRYQGAIGKAMDIHDSRMQMADLERIASTDPLTGLFNHANARKQIEKRLQERPEGYFVLAVFDMDHFKSANDERGHLFGDQLLIHLAQKLRKAVRGGDIAARVGGDEFLIFLECKGDPEPAIGRIHPYLQGEFEGFPISLSMGVADTRTVGTDYDRLFHAADNALYFVKRHGRGHYRLYDPTMADVLSVITPIAGAGEEKP